MKVVFTIAGPIDNTLADDTAAPKLAGVIEAIGAQDIVQIEPLYGGANPAKFPRGNVGGQFVFTSACSYASYNAAVDALKTAYGLLDDQGTLVFTPTGAGVPHTLTMANAILHSVQVVRWTGVRLELRYTFEITTIT